MKLNTLASAIGAVTNAVQLSECVQTAIKNKGSTPLDPMIPPRYRRLAAVLQIPVLIALLAGEVSKVREAFDGDEQVIVAERRGNCVYFSDGEGNPASLL